MRMNSAGFLRYLPQFLITIAANGGSFLYGICLAWSAPSGPKILSEENSFPITQIEFAWAVSLLSAGGALSCVVSGIFRARFGTRLTILAFALPNLLGWLLIIFASSPMMLIIGRLLIGIAGGAFCSTIPVYIGEIASKEIRGVLLTLFQSSVDLGVLFVSTLGWKMQLFNFNCVVGVLGIVYTIGFMFLPETPVYLVAKNRSEEAAKSMRLIRGPNHDIEGEMCELQKAFDEAAKAPKSSFMIEIRKRATFKAFVIIIVLFFIFQMSGINAVIFYTTTIFIESGISIDPNICTIVLSLIEVFATIFSASIVDRFGRVALLKASLSMTFTGLVGIGSYFIMKDYNVSFYENFTWLPLPSLCIFVFGFSIGLSTVPFILLGEIFSDEAKKVIAPLGQTMNNAMSFAIGLLYPALVIGIGSGMAFFMFAGFIFLGLIFTAIFIPETKGKSLAEIQTLLGAKKQEKVDKTIKIAVIATES